MRRPEPPDAPPPVSPELPPMPPPPDKPPLAAPAPASGPPISAPTPPPSPMSEPEPEEAVDARLPWLVVLLLVGLSVAMQVASLALRFVTSPATGLPGVRSLAQGLVGAALSAICLVVADRALKRMARPWRWAIGLGAGQVLSISRVVMAYYALTGWMELWLVLASWPGHVLASAVVGLALGFTARRPRGRTPRMVIVALLLAVPYSIASHVVTGLVHGLSSSLTASLMAQAVIGAALFAVGRAAILAHGLNRAEAMARGE